MVTNKQPPELTCPSAVAHAHYACSASGSHWRTKRYRHRRRSRTNATAPAPEYSAQAAKGGALNKLWPNLSKKAASRYTCKRPCPKTIYGDFFL